MQQGLGHVLLDHALAHAKLLGDLLVGQAMQLGEQEGFADFFGRRASMASTSTSVSMMIARCSGDGCSA